MRMLALINNGHSSGWTLMMIILVKVVLNLVNQLIMFLCLCAHIKCSVSVLDTL